MTTWTAPNDPLGAFCRENHAALKGSGAGPLAGFTFAAKDAFNIAGARTGFGQPDWLRTHETPRETAAAVKAVLAAGADMTAKTHCDELCYSLTGENVHFGTPVNVNAPGRVPGGSSNGSAAAVAGGLVDFALGTIAAARCEFLRAIAASSGCVRRTDACPMWECCRLARASMSSAGSRGT